MINDNNETPPARVNITLDVNVDGIMQKKELPLKLLILAGFSGDQTKVKLAERTRINVNNNNFNHALAEIKPTLSFSVDNKISDNIAKLPVNLAFNHINDFRPESILRQVPQLKKLMAMRHLLKDLKAQLHDNPNFQQRLNIMLNKKSQLQKLQQQLQQAAPMKLLEVNHAS